MSLDPFALLGLNENYANLASARQAYYALALDTHPDRFAGNSDQFRVVHAAWKWVEEQLEGVPDAGEVVARFEVHRAQWKEFLENQTGDLPAFRDVVDACRVVEARHQAEVFMGIAFDAQWDAQPAANIWPAFPSRGYQAPVAQHEPVMFPARQLVVYEAPAPMPDRLTCRLPAPTGVAEPDDLTVLDSTPLGCDYKMALSAAPADQAEDPRVLRTTVDALERERGLPV